MIVRIERKGNFFNQLIFDLSGDKFEFHILSDMNDLILELPFKGYYDIIDNHFLILYKDENEFLSLKIDELSFFVTDTFSIKYYIKNNRGALIVKDEDKSINIEYNLLEKYPVSTLYYSEEDEDANFGLWLSNVLNSEDRKTILLNSW